MLSGSTLFVVFGRPARGINVSPAATLIIHKEETMAESALSRLTVVGVFAFLLSAFVLFLFPGTVAGDDPTPTPTPYPSAVGIREFDEPDICWMIDPVDGSITPIPAGARTEDKFIAPPGADLPVDTPPDVIALLRCQTTFTYEGPAVKYSGSNNYSCYAYYVAGDPPTPVNDITTYWTQTVKAGGDATLTCHFRRNTSN
jgi:hypothetical protein